MNAPRDPIALSEAELSRLWCEEGRAYAEAINEFVEHGEATGWAERKPEPCDTREDLAPRILEIIRSANSTGDVAGLQERFPPAHAPFSSMLEANGQSLSIALWLDDERIITRVGAPWE